MRARKILRLGVDKTVTYGRFQTVNGRVVRIEHIEPIGGQLEAVDKCIHVFLIDIVWNGGTLTEFYAICGDDAVERWEWKSA